MKQGAYGIFARYYDALTQNVNYSERAAYLEEIFHREGTSPHTLLDLACGTGSLTLELVRRGYDLIGADASEEMLARAQEKLAGQSVLLLRQDMQQLDLYGTVDAAVCALDSLNHLPDLQALRETFRRVRLFLNPGGLFVFDLNTRYKYENILAQNAFVYDCDGFFCAWQNDYRPKSRSCRIDLTFFEKVSDRYRRGDEHFSERYFADGAVRRCLEEAELSLEHIYGEWTFSPPEDNCERTVYVVKKTT